MKTILLRIYFDFVNMNLPLRLAFVAFCLFPGAMLYAVIIYLKYEIAITSAKAGLFLLAKDNLGPEHAEKLSSLAEQVFLVNQGLVYMVSTIVVMAWIGALLLPLLMFAPSHHLVVRLLENYKKHRGA